MCTSNIRVKQRVKKHTSHRFLANRTYHNEQNGKLYMDFVFPPQITNFSKIFMNIRHYWCIELIFIVLF